MRHTDAGGVVLLHGLANTVRIMRRMEMALQSQGYATLNLSYHSLSRSLVSITDQLVPRVSVFADQQEGPLHFVGHSLGGLVIRAYLQRNRPVNLGRVVMLGTPNQGSELADLAIRLRLGRFFMGRVGRFLTTKRSEADESLLGCVDYPLGVIAGAHAAFPQFAQPVFKGRNDGKVSVQSTRLIGMADHIVVPVAHTMLPRSRLVIDQTLSFLRDGKFAPQLVSN